MVCPGGSTCADGQTCCNSGTGTYDCCPNVNGVCCSGDRCCQSGNVCCYGEGCCSVDYPVCCGGNSGCCTSDHPVCCDDYCCTAAFPVCCNTANSKRCCPAGYVCDLNGNCTSSGGDQPLQESVKPKVLNVYCPDGYECKNYETCCYAGLGEYACCPELNGVCCSDGKHCCPSGHYCGTTHCLRTGSNFPLLQLIGRPEKEKSPTIVCPDNGTCKDGQTCCSVGGGSYGCCPIANANCCSDMTHCCPEGYSCAASACVKPPRAEHPLLKLVLKPQKDILK